MMLQFCKGMHMSKCKRCGNDLSSNGFCHICLSYDQSVPSYIDYRILCPVCKQYFAAVDEFSEHIKSHPKCEYCKAIFNSENELHNHLKTHECPICHLYFYQVTKHKILKHPQCNLCGKRFLDRKALDDHLANHPKYCSLCKKWFLDEKALDEHLTEHPQCKYCGKRFGTQTDLANHIHSFHECIVCHKYFTNVRSHLEENHPYCRTCKRYFLDKDRYEEKHPKCPYCEKRFEADRLEMHIRRFHYCVFCKNYFHSVDTHIRSNHPEQVPIVDAIDDYVNRFSLGGGHKKKFK